MAQGALPTTVVIDPDSDGQGQADRPTLEEAQERIESEPGFASTVDKLERLSTLEGDLSGFLTAEGLRELGAKVVEDYEQDKKDRKECTALRNEYCSAQYDSPDTEACLADIGVCCQLLAKCKYKAANQCNRAIPW